ncbi:MAG: hypothetical protein K2X81_16365, partial [Candidatus Obscuribacterales bacterium]|nr:hypothetical protein [Candidatus Obscuribacterales bacterium]
LEHSFQHCPGARAVFSDKNLGYFWRHALILQSLIYVILDHLLRTNVRQDRAKRRINDSFERFDPLKAGYPDHRTVIGDK